MNAGISVQNGPGAGREVRVVHIIIGLETGGAELTLFRLASSGQPGIRHIVVSLTDEGPVAPMLRAANVEVHALGMMRAIDAPRTVLRLRRLLRSLAPDIVQTWMYHADFLGSVAVLLGRQSPLIWSVRSADLSRAPWMTRLLQRACAWLSPVVPEVVIFAGELARRLHERLGYRPRRALVIRNGFDTKRLRATTSDRRQARALFGFADDDLVIGWVGRLHPDKDPETFMRAAAIVAEQRSDVRFLMVGRGLDEANAEVSAARALAGLEGKLVLAGRLQDPKLAYAAMDIFCLSSRTEAFPNVLGEAMASGRPCVATDVGDAALLIGNRDHVAPPRDSVALAARLIDLCDAGARTREVIGETNQRRVADHFDMAVTHQAYTNLYRDLIAARGGR